MLSDVWLLSLLQAISSRCLSLLWRWRFCCGGLSFTWRPVLPLLA